MTATTFAATIDDATRFGAAKQVRSYLGLVPREYGSVERRHRGRRVVAVSFRPILVAKRTEFVEMFLDPRSTSPIAVAAIGFLRRRSSP